MSESGEVYFIKISGLSLIKVGYAANAQDRLYVLQTASPFDLCLMESFAGTKADERAIQRFLASHRYRREWFRGCDEVDELMEDLAEYRLETWMAQNKDNLNLVSTQENPWPGLEDIPISPYVAEHCRVRD